MGTVPVVRFLLKIYRKKLAKYLVVSEIIRNFVAEIRG
jgi:hypothetical protein